MNASGLTLFLLAIQGHAKITQDTLAGHVIETLFDKDIGDLNDVTLGKWSSGGDAVSASTPSSALQLDTTAPQQAPVGAYPSAAAAGGAAPGAAAPGGAAPGNAESSATDSSSADPSQTQPGGAKFQKMLEQYQKSQKEIQKVEDHFQKKLGELQNSLTWAQLRPAMKKSWTCSIDCADNGKADDFASCLQKCSEPIQQQHDALQNYLQQILQQNQQCSEGCMEQGGQNGADDQQVHCHAKCAKEVEKQLPDYKDQIEKLMEHPQEAQI